MKKKYLFLMAILFLHLIVKGQTAYYDALSLNNLKNKDGSNVAAFDILTKKVQFKADSVALKELSNIIILYLSETDKQKIKAATNGVEIYDVLKESLKENPFFSMGTVQHSTAFLGKNNKGENILGLNVGSAVSSLSGLDVTNFADGLAKFLVKRTKEELNIAFFTRFKEEISKPEYRDLQSLFPQTHQTLLIIGEEMYNYEAYIQTLRECFEKDLRNLPTNLPRIIENHPAFFKKYPQLAATLNSSCYIAAQLRDKVHPGDILKDYPSEYLDKLNPNWEGSIQTLQLISASLRDSESDSTYWVNPSGVKKLVKDDVAFRIYLGLLYQLAKRDYDGVKFSGTVTLVGILDGVARANNNGTYEAYKNYIARFSEKAAKLNAMIVNYKKPANDSLAIEQFYQYSTASIDLLEYCTKLSTLPHIKDIPALAKLEDTLKVYFDAANYASNLMLDINRRNYPSAIVDTWQLYSILFHKDSVDAVYANLNRSLTSIQSRYQSALEDLEKKIKELSSEKESSGRARIKAQIKALNIALAPYLSLKNEMEQLGKIDELMNALYKYGTFMATIVQAKSSDEVANAIEAFALPTGSSRIKRETPFNVSLNAYVGLYGGHERIVGVDNKQLVNSFGVTAPVGVSISTGGKKFLFMPCKKEGHWSYSLFLSVIDIGALASFRFGDDTTSQIPKVQLKDIVSPGLFFSIGIPKCPLSINLGAQMGPNLRKVYSSDPNNDISNNVYFRYSASLCVDIPLLNFYTKSKK